METKIRTLTANLKEDSGKFLLEFCLTNDSPTINLSDKDQSTLPNVYKSIINEVVEQGSFNFVLKNSIKSNSYIVEICNKFMSLLNNDLNSISKEISEFKKL